MKTQEEYDVGVLVGRFQVPELHDAHRALIRHVIGHHGKVIVVLGLSPVLGSRSNPLDYEARKQMLLAEFPDIITAFIKDVNNDALWSRQLDRTIGNLVTPSQSVVLYGGRDSFIAQYSGRHPTCELVQESWVSGKAMRKQIAREGTMATPDFRKGAVWAAFSRHETAFPTVDVAVFNHEMDSILLGKRDYEPAYRFLGGFVKPKTPSLEWNAQREVKEEAGIEISELWYITSCSIDDWRYRQEDDGIMTTLFGAKYHSGKPTPGDDIDEVRWFRLYEISADDVMSLHHPLLDAVLPRSNSAYRRD